MDDVHPFTSVPTTVYVVVAVAEEVGVAVVAPVKELAGDQTYPVPPVAVNPVVVPEQIETALPALIVGKGFTVTVTTDVLVQPPPAVPTTVYVVVVVGLATGFAIVELLNVAEGVQAYVVAPVAPNVVEEPLQMAELTLLAVTVIPPTVIVTTSVAVHPPASVPTTVYVVVVDGVATGFEIAGLSNVAAGDHK